MSTKERMKSAKAYINDGQRDKARKILKTVNHPTARQWLQQLDETHPVKSNTVASCCMLSSSLF